MGLWQKIDDLGIDTSIIRDNFDETKVQRIYDFLQQWSPIGGFFSKADQSRILERHAYESMIYIVMCIEHFASKSSTPVSHKTKIADVGSGPGIPGLLLLAWKGHNFEIHLIDSSRRRLALVEKHFAHDNEIHFHYERAEEIDQQFDLVLSRAFLPLPLALEVVTNLVKMGGYYYFFSGHADPVISLPLFQDHLKLNGYVSCETIGLPELEFLGERNTIVLFKNRRPMKGYPRSWLNIKKSENQWKKS